MGNRLDILKLTDKELIEISDRLFIQGLRPYEIANRLGWSASQYNNRIKEATGFTPSWYRKEVVLKFINSGRNQFKRYTEIAAETGIKLSYLYTVSSWDMHREPEKVKSSAIARKLCL